MLISGLLQVFLDEPGDAAAAAFRAAVVSLLAPLRGLGAGAAAGWDAGLIPCCSG